VDGGKGSDAVVILIAHITSSGDIAGPKELEHHVDVICAFNSPSKRSKQRSLGCEGKNRFGDATKEIFFEMTGKGLVERTMVSDGGDESDSDYSVFEGDYEENEESYDVEGFEIHTGKSKPKNDFG
jgi:DNA repair protein RadA/Sms